MDIVLTEDGKKVGFLAQDVEEYKDAMLQVIMMPESERLEMAEGRANFQSRGFIKIIKLLFNQSYVIPRSNKDYSALIIEIGAPCP